MTMNHVGKPDMHRKRAFKEDEGPTGEQVLEQTLLNLTNQEDEIQKAASLLSSESPKSKVQISDILTACLLELPHKLENYVKLLCQVSGGDLEEIHKMVVEKVLKHLKDSISSGTPWRHFVQGLRIIAAFVTVKVLDVSSYENILNRVINRIEISTSPAEQAFLFFSLFVSIPLAWGITSESFKNSLVKKYQTYLEMMKEEDKIIVELFKSFEYFNDPSRHDTIQYESNHNNPVHLDNVDDLLMGTDDLKMNWDFSFRQIRIFEDSFTCAEVGQWEILLFCRILVDSLQFNHKKCAEVLLNSIPEGAGSCERIIVEFLFGELLQNKSNKFPNLFYESILIDCCRVSRAFPPALAKALQIFFSKLSFDGLRELGLSGIEFEAIERISSWFSYHLSNFDLKWNWNNWSEVLEAPQTSLKLIFVRKTLGRVLSLSYIDRVSASLPDQFKAFLPLEPTPIYKFALNPDYQSTDEDTELATNICNLIQNRRSIEEIKSALGVNSEDNSNDGNLDLMQKEVLIQSLLNVGSKSLSHTQAVIERFLQLFQLLVNKDTTDPSMGLASNLFLMDQIYSFWKRSPLHLEFVVERLVSYRILNAHFVLQWIFDRSEEQLLDNQGSFYEVINGTFSQNLILKVLEQSSMAKIIAMKKLKDSMDEDKLRNTILNLEQQFLKNVLTFTLERLSSIRERVAIPNDDEASLTLDIYCVNLVNVILHNYPSECNQISQDIISLFGKTESVKKNLFQLQKCF